MTQIKEPRFFFDTADLEYVKKCWAPLKESGQFSGKEVVGITTNPNALDKINAKSKIDLKNVVPRLCEEVTKIRDDSLGVVYVQMPNSLMFIDEIKDFARFAKSLSDGDTKIGLKIPPYFEVLKHVHTLKDIMDLNVTGIADCSTALMCLSYDVRYVSVIPGRMEEKGIDAKSQVRYIMQRNTVDEKEVITGSMRTLEGLDWVIEMGTVPTIGWRVFDKIIADQLQIMSFKDMWKKFFAYSTCRLSPLKFSPPIDSSMTNLSKDFFKQMDDLGQDLYKEFKL